ncbi:MAG: hypothetical protein RLY16_574 [Bacteroidota bacterium]
MQNRRSFLRNAALTAGGMLVSQSLLAEIMQEEAAKRLIILHTNDVHSRIEPFPMDGGRNQGLGGVAARAAIIDQIRATGEQVLLLDAGDIFQGTPFFNIYKGEPEMKAMAAMGYDAVTMGNHDFDAGLDNFATQLQHVKFPVIVCNYDFTNTPMEGKTIPYRIFRKGKLKIGVTGVGIEMKGLIAENLYGNARYMSPIEHVNNVAAKLKKEEGCDMVICLSHLGYSYKEDSRRICDKILAKETEYVDLIIGGHTHTFLDEPELVSNKIGGSVIINQVGWAGIKLGRLDYEFSKNREKNLTKSHTVIVGKKTSE